MANKKKRENGKIQRNITKIFLTVLVLFLIGNLFVPSKPYAEKEREYFVERPKFTWESFWTGSFMDEYEMYLENHFVGKSLLKSISAPLGFVSGNSMVSDVYCGRQKQLLEDIVLANEKEFQENVLAISDFVEANPGVSMSMLIIPDAAEVWHDKLPLFAHPADQSLMINRLQKSLDETLSMINVSETFAEHRDEKLFYQTDYHWTSLGAYYAFKASAPALEIPEEGLSDFVSYSVTTNFTGALSARSGYLKSVKEDISIYVPGGRNVEVVVNYVDEGVKRTSIFNSEELEGKDKYQVFLGEDTALIDIKTTADSDRKLLIFKDSSANSFVQFLLPYFREIVLVDAELYDGKAEKLMRTYQISDVMFLYRGNTFFSENQLSGVLAGE